MEREKTIHYYNVNAKEFIAGTISVDFEFTQRKFIDKLPKNAAILDFGCGRAVIRNILFPKDTK